MTSPLAVFGTPKNDSPGTALVVVPTAGEKGNEGVSEASPEAVAGSIAEDLKRLNERDVRNSREALDRKYQRLRAAYAHGLQLCEDSDLRDRFFLDSLWLGYSGHKPKLKRHGPNDAMWFAVMVDLVSACRHRLDALPVPRPDQAGDIERAHPATRRMRKTGQERFEPPLAFCSPIPLRHHGRFSNTDLP